MTAIKLTRIAMRSACLSLGLAASIATAQTGPVEPVDSFWTDWVALWNGDLGLADEVIAQRVVLHTTLLDGRDPAAIDDPQAFAQWVGSLREAIPDLAFETVAGPVSDTTGPDGESIVAGHWRATGTYQGAFPGASAVAGTSVEFTGTDMVRVKDGAVVEYWLVSDTLTLLSQLGVGS